MRIGKLDQRIRIESAPAPDPDYGTPTGNWVTVASEVWAEVQEVLPSRAERLAGELRIAERPARVRTRYRADISSAMRIVLLDRGNRVMRIVTPAVELGRREGLEFMVVDYGTDGAA